MNCDLCYELWLVVDFNLGGTQEEIQAAWNEIEGTTVPSMGGHEYRYPFCTKSLEGKLFYMPLGYPNSIGMASEKGGQEFGIQIFPACSLYIYIHTCIQIYLLLHYITLCYISYIIYIYYIML